MVSFELVVPAYNEEKSIETFIRTTQEAAETHGLRSDSFQLIVVDNGSTDRSASVLNDLKKTVLGAWFRVVTVPVNKGYGHGLMKGLKTVSAPIVGWSHADLQCDPVHAFEAYQIVSAAKGEKVLVKGKRRGRNWKDFLVSRVFETFARVILGLNQNEVNAQPKIFPRPLLAQLKNPPLGFPFDLYALYHARKEGYRIETIPVLFPPRIHGASKWAATFFSRYKTILNMIGFMFQLARTEGRLK